MRKNINNKKYMKVCKACLEEQYMYKKILKKLELIERQLDYNLKNYEENKNAQLMIMERLENIADFLRNNYNVVIEERERYSFNPYDD